MKEKILIVGGTGFIGYHLIKKLKQKRYIIHSISKKKPKKDRYISGIKYHLVDISNFKKLKLLIENIDFSFVINLGGYVDHSDIKKTYNSHFKGCKNLATIFLKSKIKSFIQMGSSGEYGNSKSPHSEYKKSNPVTIYNRSKKLATNFLIDLYKKKKFPVTILRLYLSYGPNQDNNRFIPIVINNCLKKKEFPLSHCEQYRDFIYIDDVVNALICSIDNHEAVGQIINIGTGKPIKLKKIINRIKNYINGGKPLFGLVKLRKDENLRTYPNIFKAKKILRWKPRVSFEKGLIKTINYYKRKNYLKKFDY